MHLMLMYVIYLLSHSLKTGELFNIDYYSGGLVGEVALKVWIGKIRNLLSGLAYNNFYCYNRKHIISGNYCDIYYSMCLRLVLAQERCDLRGGVNTANHLFTNKLVSNKICTLILLKLLKTSLFLFINYGLNYCVSCSNSISLGFLIKVLL